MKKKLPYHLHLSRAEQGRNWRCHPEHLQFRNPLNFSVISLPPTFVSILLTLTIASIASLLYLEEAFLLIREPRSESVWFFSKKKKKGLGVSSFNPSLEPRLCMAERRRHDELPRLAECGRRHRSSGIPGLNRSGKGTTACG